MKKKRPWSLDKQKFRKAVAKLLSDSFKVTFIFFLKKIVNKINKVIDLKLKVINISN